MKSKITTILIFLCNFCHTQAYFNNVIPTSEYYVESAYSQMLELDSSFLGFILHSSFRNKPGQENKLCKINYGGEINSLNGYLDSVNYEGIVDIVKFNDKFYLSGLKYNSNDKMKEYWISRANNNLDILWTKTFKGIYNHCVIKDVFVEDENRIICSAGDINQRSNGTWLNGRAIIFAMDSSGNLQFYNTIQGPDTVSLDSYDDVIIAGDKNIYACGYSYKRTLDQEPLIVKLSPDGKLVWRKQIVDSKYNEVLVNIFQEPDSTILCIGASFNEFTNPTDFSYVLLMNLDNLGNLNWTKRIYKGYINECLDCIKNKVGNIVCGGSYQANKEYIRDGWIINFNSRGDTIWSRVINHDDSTSEGFSHISQASDGGYYLTGYSWVPGDNSSKAWIVKMDSFGCVVPGCEKVVSVEDIKSGMEKAFVMFPNPVSERFFFLSRITVDEPLQMLIHNLQGELVQTYKFRAYEGHQYQLDLKEDIPSGLYNVTIVNAKGMVLFSEKMEKV